MQQPDVPARRCALASITNRVKTAIARLGELQPDLGRHLDAAVRTGTLCAYRPESDPGWTVVP
jgi:hypothetical protein